MMEQERAVGTDPRAPAAPGRERCRSPGVSQSLRTHLRGRGARSPHGALSARGSPAVLPAVWGVTPAPSLSLSLSLPRTPRPVPVPGTYGQEQERGGRCRGEAALRRPPRHEGSGGARGSAGPSALPRRPHRPPPAALDPCPPSRSRARRRRRVPGQTPGRQGGREKGEPSPPSAQDASGMEAAGGPRGSATLTASSSEGDPPVSLLRAQEGFPPASGAAWKRDRTARTRPGAMGNPLPER